jgi:hypothetical protein
MLGRPITREPTSPERAVQHWVCNTRENRVLHERVQPQLHPFLGHSIALEHRGVPHEAIARLYEARSVRMARGAIARS